MPSNVIWFEILMYLALAIGFLVSIPELPDFVVTEPEFTRVESTILSIVGLSLVVLLFAAFGLLIWLTARRRKIWALWLLLTLSILGVLFEIKDAFMGEFFRNGAVIAALNILSIVVEVVAFYLILTGNARAWFNKPIATP